jgi:hypothetical protein
VTHDEYVAAYMLAMSEARGAKSVVDVIARSNLALSVLADLAALPEREAVQATKGTEA